MSKKYTTEELAQIYDKKDWAQLWKIMEPMVKHAVKRCMQEGLDPFYVRDDLMQEAYLAAWECLPRWNAFEAGLQTWVRENVRIAVTDANRRAAGGMIGGRDVSAVVVRMHGVTPQDDGGDDEAGIGRAIESRLAYAQTPEGYGDPAVEPELEAMLGLVPERDRDMVRRLCGIGVPAETQAEYAAREGVGRSAIAMRVKEIRNFLTFSPKAAKQVMTVANSGTRIE